MAYRLEQVGLAGRHATKGIAGANLGDSAFVAVNATIVAHLEKKRPIPKPIATLDAFGATDA